MASGQHTHYPSLNCWHSGNGAGDWQYEYPVGTGVEQCKALCDALPYGVGEWHCSLIVVRSDGQCYVKDGPVNLPACEDQGPTKDVYVRDSEQASILNAFNPGAIVMTRCYVVVERFLIGCC